MANVTAPFFSTWASGSIFKTLNVRACFNGNKFVMAMHKQRSGKRHPIQIHNAKVFKSRIEAANKSWTVWRNWGRPVFIGPDSEMIARFQ